MASISTIPPELLLDILSIAIASSLVTQPLIVHGQFSQLPSMCRTCCYRQIAGVCSTWAQIIREEFMARETVFGVYGSEKDEEVLAYVAKDQGKASRVKKVDASLRGWQGWKSLPPVASFDTTTEEEGEGTMGFLQTREVQLEKQRQQVLNRYVVPHFGLLWVDLTFQIPGQRSTKTRSTSYRLSTSRKLRHRRWLLQRHSSPSRLVPVDDQNTYSSKLQCSRNIRLDRESPFTRRSHSASSSVGHFSFVTRDPS